MESGTVPRDDGVPSGLEEEDESHQRDARDARDAREGVQRDLAQARAGLNPRKTKDAAKDGSCCSVL